MDSYGNSNKGSSKGHRFQRQVRAKGQKSKQAKKKSLEENTDLSFHFRWNRNAEQETPTIETTMKKKWIVTPEQARDKKQREKGILRERSIAQENMLLFSDDQNQRTFDAWEAHIATLIAENNMIGWEAHIARLVAENNVIAWEAHIANLAKESTSFGAPLLQEKRGVKRKFDEV